MVGGVRGRGGESLFMDSRLYLLLALSKSTEPTEHGGGHDGGRL